MASQKAKTQKVKKTVNDQDIYSKMADEAINAQNADLKAINANRGGKFEISQAKPYIDAVNKMKPAGVQSKEVFDLHVRSVNSHYEILKSMAKTIRPEDDPMIEHYQTPAILEILYEEDPKFRKSVDVFINAIGKSEALIGRESVRRYGGFYGPTCVVDFAFVPGSTANVVNRILQTVDIPVEHKRAILSAKSWGMDTSYGIGGKFQSSIEEGKTVANAVKDEIKTLKMVYDSPMEAQGKLMDEARHSSFDVRKYMKQYMERMKPAVKAAMDAGVFYGNIVTVPAYCVGDIGHHISQSMYNMTKDDMVMEIINAVSKVMENTLKGAKGKFKNEYSVLSVATGATAAAATKILWMDGFTTMMVIDLLTKRFHNLVLTNPTRSPAAELHNVDFMDMIERGERILDHEPRGSGCTIQGIPVDLSPIQKNEVVMNPQRYTYPGCGITVRFSALMRLSDFPCLLTSEPVTATLMTNIIALHKDQPFSPARVCKFCSANYIDYKCAYCNWKEAV
ncbi:DUF2193 domain-containing protein [Methanocella sp. CWC-04]|uniref:DUF2193 domain-containing protein n=1 Tax=Methanooceanicella nereidis TaxID=2052831 RepID=A0AAP2W5Z4_9EURY|nr:DUF2193 domain-containing protein [Methanocella sp. CWC-04]MCD1294687.1 DUF2193 domain-containing protein [Methanocella sp. CWC-04]